MLTVERCSTGDRRFNLKKIANAPPQGQETAVIVDKRGQHFKIQICRAGCGDRGRQDVNKERPGRRLCFGAQGGCPAALWGRPVRPPGAKSRPFGRTSAFALAQIDNSSPAENRTPSPVPRRIHRWSAAEELYYVYNGLNVVNEYDRWGQVAASYDFGLPGGMIQQAQWQLLGNRLHSGVGGAAAAGLAGSPVAGGGGTWLPDSWPARRPPPRDLRRRRGALVFQRRAGFYNHAGPWRYRVSWPVITTREEYDSWGGRLISSPPSFNRIHFTNYRLDPETGRNYAMMRYYGSELGRYLQVDSVERIRFALMPTERVLSEESTLIGSRPPSTLSGVNQAKPSTGIQTPSNRGHFDHPRALFCMTMLMRRISRQDLSIRLVCTIRMFTWA